MWRGESGGLTNPKRRDRLRTHQVRHAETTMLARKLAKYCIISKRTSALPRLRSCHTLCQIQSCLNDTLSTKTHEAKKRSKPCLTCLKKGLGAESQLRRFQVFSKKFPT